MEIVIRPTPADVALTAADIVADHVTRGPAVLGLATGSTPLATYSELIRRHTEHGLSFADCVSFNLDEYVGLPKDHPESYREVIRREFTSHIDIPDAKVEGPDGTASDLAAEGARYEAAIDAAGGVDVQLLGIGTDGHIGFNEPGSSLASLTRIKTLTTQTREDNARFFSSIDEVPIHVLTQGLGTISRAKHLLLLATGAGKAEAIEAAVEGPVAAFCPASVLQLHPHVTVVIDDAAASRLRLRDYYRHVLDNKPADQPF
ncbi:Glucosamine-6-phosphate deaminase OS=Tsukamurella paurometabola (strain ATCC 8368 / DSM / CCUG 35730 / CIP 100753 / JCM 10117 / KCTC 9821 / NBRC 16120 /NCIMB 702349 / NCTC 13040) OX=521096 GN=nagB PE=3 SV=1 [Tsukamurella paurometabola]|uniref:Glucosamine-6-phosphate deaminase n=1 Tax=Tsukamurella paurometabola (strain ATCC 8368 / DSM 20162 / CCUG 35730 / CIP 100753 / JCM 10117 / KCTC 9821 / NBRC 16120 / NCIMB 702349 / NCTC 13040) TaxID=521096 RepID=D5USY2_TSUPD|nr:glucosamine-6-phosphate deaminase [Tsukamurella paurometabola]ADG77269.1 glucosamine-6-phosphate isomerase [Tsukamurella paurometabola DSM 20162]SUP43337.1 Glucosamine-6-phosphate deaminase [Tsukamurella paurometabola]